METSFIETFLIFFPEEGEDADKYPINLAQGDLTPDAVLAYNTLRVGLRDNTILTVDDTNWMTWVVTWLKVNHGRYTLQTGGNLLLNEFRQRWGFIISPPAMCEIAGIVAAVFDTRYGAGTYPIWLDVNNDGTPAERKIILST